MSKQRKTVTLTFDGKDRRVKIGDIVAFGMAGPAGVFPGDRIDSEDNATVWTPIENLKVDDSASEILKKLKAAGAGADFFPAVSPRVGDENWHLNKSFVRTIEDISLKRQLGRKEKSVLLIDCTPPKSDTDCEWEFTVDSTAKAFEKKYPWSSGLFVKGESA